MIHFVGTTEAEHEIEAEYGVLGTTGGPVAP